MSAEYRAGCADVARGQSLRASWRVGTWPYRLGAIVAAARRWLS